MSVSSAEDASKKPTIVISLCGVQGCCPTVEIGDSKIVIRDDFGGEVTLTPEQGRALAEIKEISE